MKHLTLMIAVAFIFANCSSSHDTAAQKALSGYKNFVDSIYAQNEVWKVTSDTDYVETPIDPFDPSKIIIDTIVTLPKAKTTIVQHPFLGKNIQEAYQPLKAEMEKLAPKMEEAMKKEYEQSRQKFESMMAK